MLHRTELTPRYPMLQMQDLAAIDSKRSRYYTLSRNVRNKNVSLNVFSLAKDYKMTAVPMPGFLPSPSPDLGQGVAVDPTDGTIILMGHDAKRAGRHSIYKCDPTTFALTFVADIGGEMDLDLLGEAFTYDHDAHDLYVSLVYNVSGFPSTKFLAVSLEDGTVRTLPKALTMSGIAYDSHTRRIYGNHVGPHMHVKNLTLAYFETSTHDALTFVASYPMYVSIGNIHTFDPTNRVHYALLSANPPTAPPYVHTDFCSAHKEPCPSGSSCCCEPPCTDKERYATRALALNHEGPDSIARACMFPYAHDEANPLALRNRTQVWVLLRGL